MEKLIFGTPGESRRGRGERGRRRRRRRRSQRSNVEGVGGQKGTEEEAPTTPPITNIASSSAAAKVLSICRKLLPKAGRGGKPSEIAPGQGYRDRRRERSWKACLILPF